MRTYDPPPYTAPHQRIEASRKWNAEREAHEAALEAKYGIPYDKLPSALRHATPEHPQRKTARRYNYVTAFSYRWNYRSRASRRRFIPGRDGDAGWRPLRAAYLRELEEVRQAEIEVRKQRAVKKGRGKPLPKNHYAARRDAVERREFREKSW